MLFKRFKEIYRINTDYITYIGCVQAIKSCVRKTGLTLKIIYSQQKGLRLYYEMLTQGKDKPKCCEKWEARLNTDIDWSRNFKNIVLMHMGIENDINCLFL